MRMDFPRRNRVSKNTKMGNEMTLTRPGRQLRLFGPSVLEAAGPMGISGQCIERKYCWET